MKEHHVKRYFTRAHPYHPLAQLQLVSLHSVGSQPAVSASSPPGRGKRTTTEASLQHNISEVHVLSDKYLHITNKGHVT